VLDTNTLAPGSPLTYDALAAVLVAGGFTASWNIRARNGDIAMTGSTQARNVTVSADTGRHFGHGRRQRCDTRRDQHLGRP
jgi:hypothetical protein